MRKVKPKLGIRIVPEKPDPLAGESLEHKAARKSSVLLVECPDVPGLVHAVTGVLLRFNCNIVRNHEFVDRASKRFFMRTEYDGGADRETLLTHLRAKLSKEAILSIPERRPKRVVVMASREHHCLADILVRHEFGELNAKILTVISNHGVLEPLVRRFGVPFHYVPVEDDPRLGHEARVHVALSEYDPEYFVLAKYMRILSPEFCERFPGRIINIHHSFLPAFAGARPYFQAFQRGVKIIGATAHFVTTMLDAGPILVQGVVPVDHTQSPEDMQQAGRDVEQSVLARALRLVFDDRVMLCGNRTIIFD